MDLELKGKRAIVTGSTAGIGLAIAVALAKEGAAVVVNGRGEFRVAEAVKEVRLASGGRSEIQGIAADLGSADGVDKLIKVAATEGKVDILVNNLGIFEAKPFAEIPDGDWFRFFEVNVMS